MRWNTVRCAACSAISGIDWIADDPVPITATRRPVKSTPSWGQRLVKYVGPANVSRPGMSGRFGCDSTPTARIRNRADTSSPSVGADVPAPDRSSYAADVTLVSNWMSRRRSKRSAT